jgi:hypothetical protein
LDLLARMPDGTEHQQHELELDLQLALVKLCPRRKALLDSPWPRL